MKKCPYCKSLIEPNLDIRTLLMVIALTLFFGFFGGIFFYDWKLIPKYEKKIAHDREFKKEMSENYIPVKPQKEIKDGKIVSK